MKDLMLLTRISLGSVFNINNILRKRDLKQNMKKMLGIVGIAALTIIILATSYMYSYGIGTILASLGQIEVLPELVMSIVSVFVVITTITRVKGTLFAFKDYDLLMSLPIEHNIIVTNRLLTLYIINFTFTLIVIIPSSIAYIVLAKPELGFYIYTILTLLFIPIVPMIIGTILGTIIVYIASKFKRNTFVNIVLNLLLVVGILFISTFTSSSEEKLGQSVNAITNIAKEIYPLARIYNEIIVGYKLSYFLIFAIISVALFIGYIIVIGNKFKEINSSITSIQTSTKKKKRNYSLASPVISLYKKELSRYFSSSLYVLNTGIGMIMLLIGAIATLFIKNESLDQLLEIPGFTKLAGTYLPIAIPFFIVLVYTSACSISLEGSNLWIIKSIPVSTKEIFHSKIAVNLTIILPPSLIGIIILSIGLKLSPIHGLITMLVAIVYALSTSILGLLINLIFPVFNWKTEVTVIKQSLSSLLAIFGGIATALIPIGGQYLLSGIVKPTIINLLVIGFMAIITLVIYIVLIKVGDRLFKEL